MPKPIPDKLYHYTGIAGLKGIIESQTLWATHYKYLNDGEEIVHFRTLLPNILRPLVRNALDKMPDLKARMSLGYLNKEAAVEGETNKLAATFYDLTFGGYNNPSFCEPYIVSFCTVQDERVASHGLLSQWRGYGLNGGYAVVFDTKALLELLRKEAAQYSYAPVFGGDVVYSSASDEELNDEFGDRLKTLQAGCEKLLETAQTGVLRDSFSSFVSCACCYKHWGFSEEREFRIVVAPVPFRVVDDAINDGQEVLPEKPVLSFLRGATPVPYLNLFEGVTQVNQRLPIKRIIVGPHPDKQRRKLAVEKLLRQHALNAEVTVSAIPYLG